MSGDPRAGSLLGSAPVGNESSRTRQREKPDWETVSPEASVHPCGALELQRPVELSQIGTTFVSSGGAVIERVPGQVAFSK